MTQADLNGLAKCVSPILWAQSLGPPKKFLDEILLLQIFFVESANLQQTLKSHLLGAVALWYSFDLSD